MPTPFDPSMSVWAPATASPALSRVVSTPGGDYRLWVRPPEGPAPGQSHAALWVLDGQGLFPLMAAVARRLAARPDKTGVSPLLIIGVDHAPGGEVARRYADYTWGAPAGPDGADRPYGGGAALLDFLIGPARQIVAEAAPLDLRRQALVGHSLSGLFALHAMGARPDAFCAYGAISPSVWWNAEALTATLDQVQDQGQRLFVAAGEREQGGPGARGGRRMVDGARAATEQVSRRLGAERAVFHLAADEDHASAVIATAPALMRFIGRGVDQAGA